MRFYPHTFRKTFPVRVVEFCKIDRVDDFSLTKNAALPYITHLIDFHLRKLAVFFLPLSIFFLVELFNYKKKKNISGFVSSHSCFERRSKRKVLMSPKREN